VVVIFSDGEDNDEGAIAAKFQQAELDYLLNSEAGLRTMAENSVGLPLDFAENGSPARERFAMLGDAFPAGRRA
jgi:hypothetical protein